MAMKSDVQTRYSHLALDGLSQEHKIRLVTRAYEKTHDLYERVMTNVTLSTKDALADAFLYGVMQGRREAAHTDAQAITEAARDMRTKQREYFRSRSPTALGMAKTAEAHLDRMLSSPTLPGLLQTSTSDRTHCLEGSTGVQSQPAGDLLAHHR